MASSSTATLSEEPLLACVRVLKLHFEHGGVDKKGYNILYRMVQMMSAIGWEIHVMICSKIPAASSSAKIKCYAGCILEGSEVFRKNMKASVNRTMNASEMLSELEGEPQMLEGKVKQWQNGLRYAFGSSCGHPLGVHYILGVYTSRQATTDGCLSSC